MPSVTDVPSWALSPRIPQGIRIAPPQCVLAVPPAPVPHGVGSSGRQLVALGGDTVPAATVPPAARPRAPAQPWGHPCCPPGAELLAELPGLRFATEGRGKVCVQLARCHLPGGPWGHGVAPAPARRSPPVAGTVGAPSPHHGQSTQHPTGKNKIHFFYQPFNQKTLNLSRGGPKPLGTPRRLSSPHSTRWG